MVTGGGLQTLLARAHPEHCLEIRPIDAPSRVPCPVWHPGKRGMP